MTRLLLWTAPAVDAGAVRSALNAVGVRASPLAPDGEAPPPAPAARAAAVFPSEGVVTIGEQVLKLRSFLGPEQELLVCSPQLTPKDRQAVLACGASDLVTPRAWDAPAVAERLLGELIAAGVVEPHSFGSLKGATPPMRELYGQIERVAPLSDPILVLGETGTGKELVAREIHARSGRPGRPVAINAAALSPELVESELFGHERGAFSGAITSTRGLLAEAGAGTVFLDEIGDLPLPAQAKLLRVLEEKTARPVGGSRWHPVAARFVLATNRDLEEDCDRRLFRRDLYERIRGFTLALPPLRWRRADLPLLVRHFLAEYDQEYPGSRQVPPGALDPLFRYEWPGNVRELRQTVRQAAAYAPTANGPISALHLLEATRRSVAAAAGCAIPFDPGSDTWRQVQERARTQYFRALLRATGGNKEAAAERAGMSRSQLYEILRQIE